MRVRVAECIPAEILGGQPWISDASGCIYEADWWSVGEQGELYLHRNGRNIASFRYWVRIEELEAEPVGAES